MQIILILVYLTMRPFLRNKRCLTWFDIFVLTNIFLYRCIMSKMNEVLYSIFNKIFLIRQPEQHCYLPVSLSYSKVLSSNSASSFKTFKS